MPQYEVTMRVTYKELHSVEAESEDEALALANKMRGEFVTQMDCVDWDAEDVKEVE